MMFFVIDTLKGKLLFVGDFKVVRLGFIQKNSKQKNAGKKIFVYREQNSDIMYNASSFFLVYLELKFSIK